MNETTRLSPDQLEQNIYETRRQIDETLETLQRKLSPGELLHVAADYARANGSTLTSNATAMAANAGRTARDNPIPLALLGIGLAWLMMGERRSPEAHETYTDPALEHRSGDGTGRPGDGAERFRGAAGRVGDTASSAGARATDVASTARQRFGDTAADLRASAEAGADRMRSGASEAASKARQRVGDTAADMRAGAEAGAARVRSGAAAAAARARQVGESASRAARSTGQFAQEHPLATGAVMVAAGALLAALLPRTRREDRWIGEKSDQVKAGAEQQAADLARRGRDAAEAAVSEAKSEAERKDITPERAKREAAAVAEAGGDVAVSAAEAARKELKGGGESKDTTNEPVPARNG